MIHDEFYHRLMIDTGINGFNLRVANSGDIPLILDLIRGLAEYERLAQECIATEARLHDSLFGERPYAEVVVGEYESTPVGFALFFHTFSTFLARPGIYLEDLFIKPAWRGRGFGGAMLAYLSHLAVQRGCGRVEWSVLDWNEEAIRFYERLGAKPLDDWTTFRLTGEALQAASAQFGGGGSDPRVDDAPGLP